MLSSFSRAAFCLLVAGCQLFPVDDSDTDKTPMFVRVENSGLPETGSSWGGTFADLDGDGKLDILVSRHSDELQAFLNLGGLRFRRIDESWTVPEGLKDHHAIAAYDYDNDGDSDLYLTVGAGRGRRAGLNQFWVCEQEGVYTDMAKQAPALQDGRGRGRGVVWVDLDGDATPELFVGNFRKSAAIMGKVENGWRLQPERMRIGHAPDGQAMPLPDWWVMAPGDLDLDGKADLVAPKPGKSVFLNSGEGSFVDVSDSVGFALAHYATVGAPLGDIDGDGDLDIVTAYRLKPWLTLWTNKLTGNTLHFEPTELADDLSLDGMLHACSLADFDNDGILDLYLSLSVDVDTNSPNLMARGVGDGTFEVRTAQWGAEADFGVVPHSAWPMDLDFDGDLDLVCFQAVAPNKQAAATVVLFENRTSRKGITLRLQNSEGLAEGLGAVVRLKSGERWLRREVRFVGDPYSSMVAPVHFGGLPPKGKIEIRVEWTNGETQELRLPRSGASYLIRQGEQNARRLK
jgi:hypothetical protein